MLGHNLYEIEKKLSAVPVTTAEGQALKARLLQQLKTGKEIKPADAAAQAAAQESSGKSR